MLALLNSQLEPKTKQRWCWRGSSSSKTAGEGGQGGNGGRWSPQKERVLAAWGSSPAVSKSEITVPNAVYVHLWACMWYPDWLLPWHPCIFFVWRQLTVSFLSFSQCWFSPKFCNSWEKWIFMILALFPFGFQCLSHTLLLRTVVKFVCLVVRTELLILLGLALASLHLLFSNLCSCSGSSNLHFCI